MRGSADAAALLAALTRSHKSGIDQRLMDGGLDFMVITHLQNRKVLDEQSLTELTLEQLSTVVGLIPGDALKVKRVFPCRTK